MGQVRIPVTVDKAEEAIRELRQIIKTLNGVEKAGKDTASATERSAFALQGMQRAFTPFRQNLEVFNQLRTAASTFVQAWRSAVSVVVELADRTPRTRSAMADLRTEANALVGDFVRGVDAGRGFSGTLRDMADAMRDMEGTARTAGVAVATGLDAMASSALQALGPLGRVADLYRQTRHEREAFDARREQSGVGRYLVRGDEMAEVGPDLAPWISNQGLTYTAPEEDIPRLGQGGGGSGTRRWPEQRRRGGGGNAAEERIRTAEAEAERWQTMKAAEQLAIEQEITREYRQQREALAEMNEAQEDRLQKEQMFREAMRGIEEDRIAQQQKYREEIEASVQKEIELEANRQQFISDSISQIGAMASATQSLGKAVASAYESMGGSSEKAKKAEGAFVVAYSSVMAVLELAESIRAFAKQDYVSGALHLVGMAAYIAAAVEAGSQLGGGAAKTPSAQTSYTPARTEGLGASSGEQQGATIINQYSWGRSRAEAAEAVADIEYEGARTGRVRASDSSVWGA